MFTVLSSVAHLPSTSFIIMAKRMTLSAKMEAAQSLLPDVLLTALNIHDGAVAPSASPQSLPHVLSRNTGSSGSICFVVRRPG